MAGDYRPLRSAMKKARKRTVQTKNVHHNHFLTMRGWQPHLVPFPHGFHPKPHQPRNDLWWDNVPKNVDHIMAPPAICKVPVDDPEEDQIKADTTGVKPEDKKKVEEKQRDDKDSTTKESDIQSRPDGKIPSSSAKSSSTAEPGSDKSKPKAADGNKGKETSPDVEMELAKRKAEAEAAQKAKMRAEAEASVKRSPQPIDPDVIRPLPLDPQM